MIKFLDRFGLDKRDIRQVFPDYDKLFEDIQRLESRVKEGISQQAENEYIGILESLDDFLMREENLQKFRDILDVPMIVESGKTDFTQSEAIELLEDEIYELEKEIPAHILEKKKEQETAFKTTSKVKVDLSRKVTRDMMDEDNQYFGIKFKYIQFKQPNFNRCLSMLKSGCKFLYTSFGDRNYVLLPLKKDVRLIVEVSTPVKEYTSIFGGSSDVMAYILCRKEKDVKKYYHDIKVLLSMR